MLKLNYAILITSLGILGSCNNITKTPHSQAIDSTRNSSPADSAKLVPSSSEQANYQKITANDTIAQRIAYFLQTYLKDDLKGISTSDRIFSFYELDLDNGKKNEYFIKLPEKGFCGSGGCTFILLDNNLKLINRFSVTKPPIYIGHESIEGWKTLILNGKNTNKYVHLKWDSKTMKYPSNPSLIGEIDEAPAKGTLTMWGDDANIKTYQF